MVIGGGRSTTDLISDIEVIDLKQEKRCHINPAKAKYFSPTLYSPNGGLLNGIPIVCGGSVNAKQVRPSNLLQIFVTHRIMKMGGKPHQP